MTEYRFHGRPSANSQTTATVSLSPESRFHGAAIALRMFMERGCDIAAPLAHLDVTEPGGVKHIVMVEEVLAWLRQSTQTAFVQNEGLAKLLQ